jgi:hypothetical protein
MRSWTARLTGAGASGSCLNLDAGAIWSAAPMDLAQDAQDVARDLDAQDPGATPPSKAVD